MRFIDARFRPGIQIGDEEIRKYFNEHLRPRLEQAHPGQTAIARRLPRRIEQTLISEAADQQVEQWLKEARRRTHIQYHDEVFQMSRRVRIIWIAAASLAGAGCWRWR